MRNKLTIRSRMKQVVRSPLFRHKVESLKCGNKSYNRKTYRKFKEHELRNDD